MLCSVSLYGNMATGLSCDIAKAATKWRYTLFLLSFKRVLAITKWHNAQPSNHERLGRKG